jgi:hypothetical protein
MSEVLNPKQHREPSDAEVMSLVKKTAYMEVVLTRVVTAGSALLNKCVKLGGEIQELQQRGEGLLWIVKKQEKKEFSLQLLSPLPRRLKRGVAFALRFRVIDRSGNSVMLCDSDVFKLKIKAAHPVATRHTTLNQKVFPRFQGPTIVSPSDDHEVVFTDLAFVMEEALAAGVKVVLAVSCTSRPELKPLLLESIVVKP